MKSLPPTPNSEEPYNERSTKYALGPALDCGYFHSKPLGVVISYTLH